MPELLRPAKELLLGARERDMRRELLLQKVKGADEVGNLEEPVARRFYVGGEFNHVAEVCLENLMKKSRDRGLSTVIVDLNVVDGRQRFAAHGDEFRERHLESVDDLVSGIDITFVHGEAMVSVVNPSGKGHHAGEYPTAQLTAQHGVVFFPTDERPSVEAMPLKADFAVGAFEGCYLGGDVDGLVVKDHAYNVETRFLVGQLEVARLVDKNTQGSSVHCQQNKKREWRDANLATHAESFPRIPVTHAKRRRSVGILAYRRSSCNGKCEKR